MVSTTFQGTKRLVAAVAVAAAAFTASAAHAGCQVQGSTFAFAKDELTHKGLDSCFVSSANPNGDNADLTNEVYFAHGTKVTNMTKDSRRCSGGRNAGNPCTRRTDCPDDGQCVEPSAGACSADAQGKYVYFIFDGNPTGQNADMSQELFSYRAKGGVLTQETDQHRYCAGEPEKTCTSNTDCVKAGGDSSECVSPVMGDLQVSANGHTVTFRSSGDLGGNAQHADAIYLLARHGKKTSTTLLAGGGNPKTCTSDTQRAYQACSKDADCGAVCGDGTRDASEQCESDADCGPGKTCDDCQCRTIKCGDGFVDPGEACEPTVGCVGGTCSPDCKTCTVQ